MGCCTAIGNRYVKQSKRFPCAILGVTNPYFDMAFQSWPTTVRVEAPPQTLKAAQAGGGKSNVR